AGMGAPERHARLGPEQGRGLTRHLQRVRKEDDRRLQPFGAVHGEDTHLVAPALLEVALDLGLSSGEPMQKALQRGSMHALIGERQRQELVERILGLVAQPRESRAPATARAQYLGKKLIGRREIGARQQCAEELRRSGKKRMLANAPAQFAPERALARVGKL